MRKAQLTLGILSLILGFNASGNQVLKNPFGYEHISTNQDLSVDQPVERGFITVHTEAIAKGVKLTVDIFHKEKNTGVSLWVQIAPASLTSR